VKSVYILVSVSPSRKWYDFNVNCSSNGGKSS